MEVSALDRIRKLKDNKVLRHVSKAFLCLALVAGLLFMSVPEMARAADEDVLDTTWYRLGSAAAGWLSDDLSKGGAKAKTVHGSEVGGLLGYCDEANTSGVIIDFIQSVISSSSATYSYDALTNMGGSFINYGNYGRALRSIGVDGTGTSQPSAVRMVAGNLLLLLYNLSTIVNYIFGGMISFMRKINPFRLFTYKGKQLGPWSGDGIEKAQLGVSGSETLGNYMDNIMHIFQDNWAWALVIPVSVGVLIWALFLSKRNKGYEIKKFVWRIVIIFFSIPVMGSIYSTALTWMQNEISPKNGTPAAKIVASMLVDFEGFANKNFALPPGVTISGLQQQTTSEIQDYNITSLRNTALAINGMSCSGLPTVTAGSDKTAAWNKEVSGATGNSDVTAANADVSKYIRDLCIRYALGTKYDSSKYRGNWMALNGTPFDGPIKTTVTATDTLLDWTSESASDYLFNDPSGLWVGPNGHDTPWKGMSPMAVYNYLSTEFSDSGITIYSNEKASSGFIRTFHYSVNLIGGDGMVSFLIYLNGVVMLAVLIILAFGYAGGIIIHSVMRTFKVITSIPLVLMGSLRYGAKLIGNTLMMLVEVIVSLFMYSLAVSLMYASLDIVDTALYDVLNTAGLSSIIPQSAVAIVEYLVSIFLYIFLAVMLIRYRKKAVKSVDEMVCGFVNRLVPGADANDMMEKDKPNALANGLKTAAGTAAGAAAAGALMNGLSGGSRNAQAGDSASGESTNGDTTGGGGGGANSDTTVAATNANGSNDNDFKYMEETGAGGAGFDNDSDDDEHGKDVAEADSLDEAPSDDGGDGTNHGIEEGDSGENGSDAEDGEDGSDGDDDSDSNDEASDAEAGDDADVPEGSGSAAATANAAAGDSAGKDGKAGKDAQASAVKNAQAGLSKSEEQKKALEKALGMKGEKAIGASGGTGKQNGTQDAQAAYTKALAQADPAKGGPASTVKATTGAAKAAESRKGAPLTPAEAAAANKAAAAVKSGAANSAVKGVAPVSGAQMRNISDAAVSAAKAANGGKLSSAQEQAVREEAGAMAKAANAAAQPGETTMQAALHGASAAKGGEPLSADDISLATQAASEARASAARNVSPEGLAESAALKAATAANGGQKLSASKATEVKNTARQAAESVQNAALSAAQSAKGGPLTAAEQASIRQGCGVQAAQQAAVNAVEQCMGTQLDASQRGALMNAAQSHAGQVMADNSQVRVAEKAAGAAASAVAGANNLGRMGSKEYASMMGDVRSQAQQTIANAQPVNIAARASVNAANMMRAENNRPPLTAGQVGQVADRAISQTTNTEYSDGYAGMPGYSGTEMENYSNGVYDNQSDSGSTEMGQQADAMRQQTQQNYQQIEAMKSQLMARGYTREQVNAIARNEAAASRGEGPSTPRASESAGPQNNGPQRIDVKEAAIKAGIAGAMMGSGNIGAAMVGSQMLGDQVKDMGGVAKRNFRNRNRELGAPREDQNI